MNRITELKQPSHSNCSVQYLGRDHSLGIASKAYFCVEHNVAFKIIIPITKEVKARFE